MTLDGAIAASESVTAYLQSTAIPPTPIPPPVPSTPGHEVTENPPNSATATATVFGLNWNGSNDTGDLDPTEPDGNSRGFFIDPGTGSAYVTHVTTLAGISLPREVMLSTFMNVDAWQTIGILQAWKEYASDLRNWVLAHQPTADVDSGGKYTVLDLKFVDAGPTVSTGAGVDLTYKTAHDLNTFGSALVTYRVKVSGSVIAIRGWDFVRKRVLGS